MLEGGGCHRRAPRILVPPLGLRPPRSDGPEARLEALRKLKALFDSGVLTYLQFAEEQDRLLFD